VDASAAPGRDDRGVTRRRQHPTGRSDPSANSLGLVAATVMLAILLLVFTVRLVLR
jgi:hypothetical protein